MELKLGSIPVRVQGWFVIMSLLLAGVNDQDPAKLALWVAIVTVSVIVHELGHALMGMAFGYAPRIDLHGMGGTTSFQEAPGRPPRGALGPARSIAISLAGPFAGFLFAGVVIGARLAGLAPKHPLALHAYSLLLFVNVGWGIFNLLPMLPLDGGNVMRSLATAVTKQNGEKVARVASIVVAAGIVAYALRLRQWWVIYLGLLFAYQNVQSLRQASQDGVDRSAATVIDDAYAAFQRDDTKTAIGLLQPALQTAMSPELRKVGLRIYVISLMKDEMWPEALSTMERERDVIGTEDLGRYADRLRELGRAADAERIEALGKPPELSEFRA